MDRKLFEELKNRGSKHYKTANQIEPIDLYVAGGGSRQFFAYSIVKYAFRQRNSDNQDRLASDIEKIKHYADLLYASEKGIITNNERNNNEFDKTEESDEE